MSHSKAKVIWLPDFMVVEEPRYPSEALSIILVISQHLGRTTTIPLASWKESHPKRARTCRSDGAGISWEKQVTIPISYPCLINKTQIVDDHLILCHLPYISYMLEVCALKINHCIIGNSNFKYKQTMCMLLAFY